MPKQAQPGDLVAVGRQLRRLIATLDTSAFALDFSFEELGADVEAKVQRVRAPADLLAARLEEALKAIEASPIYQAATTTAKEKE